MGECKGRSMARHAAREYAIEGRFVSYEWVQDDLYPAGLTVRANPSRRRLGSAGTTGGQATSRSRTVKAKGIGSKGSAVTIANVFVPASLADVAVEENTRQGDRWILSSKRGRTIAKFPTEGDLDRWWAAFQKIRGRAPRALRLGRHQSRNRGGRPRLYPKRTHPWFVCVILHGWFDQPTRDCSAGRGRQPCAQ